METTGVKELRDHMGRYMAKVREGETIVVTHRKKEIAVILPVGESIDAEKMCEMIQSGKASWSGGKPQGMPERVKSKGGSVSHAVIEDRR
jgi:prevent-host-death family protein